MKTDKWYMTYGELTILLIYLSFFIGDVITTAINGDMIQYLESNPLFMLTHDFTLVIIVNFMFILSILYFYRKGSVNTRYWLVNIVCWLGLLRGWAIYNNFQVYQNPPTIEQAQAITASYKLSYATTMAQYLVLLPLIIMQIVFWIFRIDHKIEIKPRQKPQQ